MSVDVSDVVVRLRTDLKQLETGLAEAKGKVSTTLNQIEGEAESQSGRLMGAVSGFIKGALVGQAVAMLGDMVQAARAAEVSEARLRSAVVQSGEDWSHYDAVLKSVIATRRVFAYSDQEQRDSLGILIQLTGSVDEAIRREAVAMDLARGKGIDLYTASSALGRVTEENIGMLRRWGVVVKDGATVQEVLAAVEAKFGTQAEGYAKTQEAASQRMANAWERAQETIGQGAINVLGPLANLSTTIQGQQTTFTGAAGAIIGFSKAGKGSVPVLSGVKSAIGGVGTALKFLFLNPVGLAILAITALVFGLHLLYDRVEPVRKALDALGSTLLHIVPGLQWIMDRLGDLGKELGLTGDAAQDMGKDFTSGSAEAVAGIKTIKGEISDLSDMLKPAGADETKKFLEAIGADPDTINAALDALYNEVGADDATRLKKLTDRAYAGLVDTFKQSDAYKEAKDNLENFLSMDAADQAAFAKSLGRTSAAAYLDELKKNSKDADALLEHYSATLAGAIQKAKDVNAAQVEAGLRQDSHLRAINAIADAWADARLQSEYYYEGVLTHGFTAPRIPRGEPRDVPPTDIGTGASGGSSGSNLVSVVANLDLHYNGDTASLAAGAASDTLDAVTEAFRQGDRRLTSA